MKHESYLFAGVSLFFLVTAAAYGWFSREPAAPSHCWCPV